MEAHTPYPSDSFPGMVGIATGGNPSSTGIYYDDEWSNDLFPPGTTNCTTGSGSVLGAHIQFTEALDTMTNSKLLLDAGQGLTGLPGNILSMTGKPRTLMDTTQLPVNLSKSTSRYYLHEVSGRNVLILVFLNF